MQRNPYHDYRSRSIYMVTLHRASGASSFSALVGKGCDADTERSETGGVIAWYLLNMERICSRLRTLQYVIMPDYVQVLLFATDRLEHELGYYIDLLKAMIGERISGRTQDNSAVFAEGFQEMPLGRNQSLSSIYEYMRSSSSRLAAVAGDPGFYTRRSQITIDGRRWHAFGNIHILANPFMSQVVVHRADTSEERERNRIRWLHTARTGGVLASPFVSAAEKRVLADAEEANGHTIVIHYEPPVDLNRPSTPLYGRCAGGRQLVLAPADRFLPVRQTFLYLNHIAAKIVENK